MSGQPETGALEHSISNLELFDILISYGRPDSKAFAIQLKQRLSDIGLKVWLDLEDIPVAADYQKQIDDSLDRTDNFLFVISPHAVNSKYCALEIEAALRQGKRIIPIMHVEEISREIWQSRHPQGTDLDWEAYQAAGMHTSHANMHPVIKRIQWISCRDRLDDFEKSVDALLEAISYERDYVRQHTVLLNQAIEWWAQNQRSRYLLVDESLQAARAWLQRRFADSRIPCIPTQLHCQFISESIKNAQNGLAEVFIVAAEADQVALEKVHQSLAGAGLALWTSSQDIPAGSDVKAVIQHRIAASDSVVFLLSPAALDSSQCQQEIHYALSLNKRIIQCLIGLVDWQETPHNFQGLALIDLTGEESMPGRLEGEEKLIHTLEQDTSYYNTHKRLLVRAIKWQQQRRNPCILLQGHALSEAEVWLQIATKRDRHGPAPIQIEFIEESREHPPKPELNVFITSDAKDLEFARQLNEQLQIYSERTYFRPDEADDQAGITSQVQESIEQAENCIFVLSNEALKNSNLLSELNFATSLSKRTIAVLYRPLDDSKLPPTLARSPQIDFKANGEDFPTNFGALYRLLKSYPDHVRSHTQLLVRAVGWEESGHDPSTLLRGKELVKAEQWLAESRSQTPEPSPLHLAYIATSRELSQKKVSRRSAIGLSAVVGILVAIARIYGLFQGLELAAYDHLLRQRPLEKQDDRFLIVTVDSESSAYLRDNYEPDYGTIPDRALDDTLNILSGYQPRLIGLDFIRDFEAKGDLSSTLTDTQNLIGICKASFGEQSGNPPAKEISVARIGFSDLSSERSSADVIRRHLLMQSADPEKCPTQDAFSLLLAKQYLAQEGIAFTDPYDQGTERFKPNGLRLKASSEKELTVPQLHLGLSGPYNQPSSPNLLGGYQTLINFRMTEALGNETESGVEAASHFAQVVTLKNVLTETLPATLDGSDWRTLIHDRIVLIGYVEFVDPNTDDWETPYGRMFGVFLHGQMASQLISAALDNRALIRWWSFNQEFLWILAWAVLGALMGRQVGRFQVLVIGMAIVLVVLYGICLDAMIASAFWLPLVPPAIAFVLAAGGTTLMSYRLRNP